MTEAERRMLLTGYLVASFLAGFLVAYDVRRAAAGNVDALVVDAASLLLLVLLNLAAWGWR